MEKLPATCKVLDGAVTVPDVIVILPATSAGIAPKLHAPPLPTKVRLLNALLPVIWPPRVFPDAVLLNVTVLVPQVNVPLFVQLPPSVILYVPVEGHFKGLFRLLLLFAMSSFGIWILTVLSNSLKNK